MAFRHCRPWVETSSLLTFLAPSLSTASTGSVQETGCSSVRRRLSKSCAFLSCITSYGDAACAASLLLVLA